MLSSQSEKCHRQALVKSYVVNFGCKYLQFFFKIYSVIFGGSLLKFQMRLVRESKFQGSFLKSIGSVLHSSTMKNLN